MAEDAAKEAAAAAEPIDVVEKVGDLMDMDKNAELLQSGMDLLMLYGPRLLAAIAIFFIGKVVANWAKRLVSRAMGKGDVDPLIIGFTSSIVYIGMMVFVVMAALGQIGIQTTRFPSVPRN